LLKGIRWGAGWCPRRRPRTHGGLIQTTALVDRPSDQSIVMSAGKQIEQASKQENEQCGDTPPKGLPQAESHKSVDSASQGGYQWQFSNCEQIYATYLQREIRAVPARSRKVGARLGDRVPAQARAGVTAPAARAVKGADPAPLGVAVGRWRPRPLNNTHARARGRQLALWGRGSWWSVPAQAGRRERTRGRGRTGRVKTRGRGGGVASVRCAIFVSATWRRCRLGFATPSTRRKPRRGGG